MKFSRSDALVSTGVFLGVVGLLWLFVVDITSSSSRGNANPLGTVVFKRMSATRRPTDALGWELIRNNSPVYNADTLRTGTLSEAAIYFDDGTSLDIGSNSMLRLDFGSENRNLEFLDGEITVGGSKSESSYVISSVAGAITVGADSSATFSRDSQNNVVGVEVNKGTATLVSVDGTTKTVQENQLMQVDVADGSASFVSRPMVPVLPERNSRILIVADANKNQQNATAAQLLDFAWVLDDKSKNTSTNTDAFILELNKSKNFSEQTLSYEVIGLEATVPVLPGTWYWRVRDQADELSPVRKFSVDVSTLPRLAFPADKSEYRYRKNNPEIRFAWTVMSEATAYVFELADSPDFKNPTKRTRVSLTNLSVSDIGAGHWYWRVTPVYGYSEVRGAETPEVRSLVIEKSGEMAPLEVSTPFEGQLYQVQELTEKGLSFAWIPHSEAVSYELVVSSTEDLSNPSMILTSNLPYVKVSSDTASLLSKPGTYYWGACWIDNEGNRSPLGLGRKLVGIDGSIAMRASFPPEGYRIADSLASNARFAWKSNIAAPTYFLLSRDSSFSTIEYQEKVSTETLIGEAWEPGLWYWKIRTLNADNSIFMETSARSFSIVEPLDSSYIQTPSPINLTYLREGDTLTFEWNEVSGADYYTVILLSPTDGYTNPIFEQSHLQKTEVEVPLGSFNTGRYKVKIQAFALETEVSTRIIGYIGESFFNYKKLEYLQLASPPDQTVFEGLDALRNGISIEYTTKNIPTTGNFRILLKEGNKVKEVARSSSRSKSFIAKKLPAGVYQWTVDGELAGFDISAQNSWKFEILPIPPLSPSSIVLPKSNAVFGVTEFRAQRSIEFEWTPVKDANRYKISLYPEDSTEASFVIDNLTKTTFELTDLSVLARGTNTFVVEAYAVEEGDDFARTGTPVQDNFVVDLPPLKQVETKTGSILYGR